MININSKNNSPNAIQIEFAHYYGVSSLVTIIPKCNNLIINRRGFPEYFHKNQSDTIMLLPDFDNITLDSVKTNNIVRLANNVCSNKPDSILCNIFYLINSKYLLLTTMNFIYTDSTKIYIANVEYKNNNFTSDQQNFVIEVINDIIENSKDTMNIKYYKSIKQTLCPKQ